MSIVDVDSWITEHDACERLSREIQSQLVLRSRENRLSDSYSRISGNIRIRLKQFTSELDSLNKKLQYSTKSRTITSEEVERRHRQLELLQSKLIHLQKQFQNVGDPNRGELFQSSGSSRLFESEEDDIPILNNDPRTIADLRKQQTQILNDQDRGLDALAQVISRQKDLAIRIGDEVDLQNEIIEDLGDTMETTNTRIGGETQNISVVSRKDATCGYYMVIGILFVAILIVALV